METKQKVLNAVLAVLLVLVAFGLYGNLTRHIAKGTPTHTNSLKQYVQRCHPAYCVAR